MKYIKQLDGLRFIAIFMILIDHFAVIIGKHISAGYYGVDLFFVISGFLITLILLNSKEDFFKGYKKFIGRRTLRIFPIYYLTITILFLAGNEFVRRYFVYCITYTFNYAWIYFNIPVNSITHIWSLCIEEQFYLFWPIIILGLRTKLRILKYIILLLIIVCGLQLYFNIFSFITPYNYAGLIPRAYSLGMGGLGALLYREKKVAKNFLETKWIEYGVLFFLIILLLTTFRIKFIFFPIISLYLILKTAHEGFASSFLNNFLSNKFVVYVGSISYGIYLYHLPLSEYITEHFFNSLWNMINWNSMGILAKLQWHSWLIKLPLYSIISIFLAHLSYKYLEKPILSLKDKWFHYN